MVKNKVCYESEKNKKSVAYFDNDTPIGEVYDFGQELCSYAIQIMNNQKQKTEEKKEYGEFDESPAVTPEAS
jgi:hypothetical protein